MKRNLLLIATGMIIAIAVLAALRATAWPFKEGETPTLAPLLERVTPAVVNIAVVGAAAESRNPLLDDPFFRRFFEGPDAPLAPPSDAAPEHRLRRHHRRRRRPRRDEPSRRPRRRQHRRDA